MTSTISSDGVGVKVPHPWNGFKPGLWLKEVDVRDFIQQNYEPYEGDGSFLAPATERTERLWWGLTKLFVEERRRGVLEISQTPSSITARTAPKTSAFRRLLLIVFPSTDPR